MMQPGQQAQLMPNQQYMATVNDQNTNQQYFQNQMVDELPEGMDEQQYEEEDDENYVQEMDDMEGMDGMDAMDGEEDEGEGDEEEDGQQQ